VSAGLAPGQDDPARRRDLLADLRARLISGQPTASQRLTCLEYECLDLAGLHPEDLRDLLMRVVAQLEQDERGSLIVRQPPDLVNHLAQILAALNLV
jgi:hypothetical protein